MSLLNKEDCQKILHRSQNGATELISFKITNFNDQVAGFLGEHLKLTLIFLEKNVLKHSTYFIKALPRENLNQLNYISDSGIFHKEIVLYRNLLSELLKIGNFGPKCYFVRDDLMVLEDLTAEGFQMLCKRNFLNEPQLVSLLQTLARYHASTLIYEKQRDTKLDREFKEEIKETCFAFAEGEVRHKWLVCCTKCVSDLIRKLDLPINYDVEKICDKLKKVIEKEMPIFLAPSKKFVNVLTHDDLWCNNMLFNERNECLMVDFQLVRYTPPAFDFLVTLYLNLDCSKVENSLNKFVDIYLTAFRQHLKNFNVDENLLSREEFERTIEIYKLPALIENALYGTHIYISDELSQNIMEDYDNYNEFSFINRSKFALKEWEESEFYQKRLTSPLILLVKMLHEQN